MWSEADREICRGLAAARRAVKGLLGPDLDDAERERRVREYTKQVELSGHIVCWLGRADAANVRRPVYRSRFDLAGDVMRPHRS